MTRSFASHRDYRALPLDTCSSADIDGVVAAAVLAAGRPLQLALEQGPELSEMRDDHGAGESEDGRPWAGKTGSVPG